MVDAQGGRSRKPTWILVVLVVVAAVAIWAAGRATRNGGTATTTNPDAGNVASTTGATSSAVNEYVRFAAADAAPSPDYVADGLRTLAGAMGSLGVGSPDLSVSLRVTAEHVLLNPEALETSGSVRTALMEAAAAIARENPPSGDALRQSLDGLDARAPLGSQHATLQQFFRQSGEAIDELAAKRGLS